MLIGLNESDPWETEQAAAWTPEATSAINTQTRSTPQSTITIYPPTVRPATAQPRTGITAFLDKVAPRTLSANGAVRVWGMPPAVAYTLVALALTGAGLYAYKKLRGTRRANPRRRSGRGRKSRRKR
jgi:hypothetical protein